jgi:hypothetical protein
MAEVKEPAMATELRTESARLYDADFYVWALEQAELLRGGRFDALDLDNLIKEVEGLADASLTVVLNSARVVKQVTAAADRVCDPSL